MSILLIFSPFQVLSMLRILSASPGYHQSLLPISCLPYLITKIASTPLRDLGDRDRSKKARKRLRSSFGEYRSMGTILSRGSGHLRGNLALRTTATISESQPTEANPLQQIYDLLSSIEPKDFLNAVAQPNSCPQIVSCLELMNRVSLEDLGLTERMVQSLKDSVCMEVAASFRPAEDRGFHIAAFLLPKGASLPIHDHPDMTVLHHSLLAFAP